ncbi:MAG: hypothetical protein ABSE89_05370 [Sedimentisphaerales bacterium]
MYRRIIICLAVCISWTTLTSFASEPNDYIIPGRALLFDGSLAGIRSAYQIFDNSLKDGNCAQCQANRELRFFHALSKTVMLLVRDDGNSIDSIFELMQKFGISILGQHWAPYFEPDTLDVNEVRNQHNTYEIPQDVPNINDFRNILDIAFIPEIDSIISDLNSISDTPANRFRIYLSPNELRIFYPSDYEFEEPLEPVEVDFGEVLLLKGLLTALKAQLEFKTAYDIYVEPNDRLFEKLYGGSFRINEDILSSHPEILKVLPTVHDSNNGAAILAQAAQDWISAINYYLNMVDYIRSEEDWQGDDFLYIDPNDNYAVNEIENRLITLRNSRINDTVTTIPMETTKTYNVYDINSVHIGQLVLVYDVTGIEGDSGSLMFIDSNITPSPWEVEWFDRERDDANRIEIELGYYSQSEWLQGWFEGTLSYDGNSITNGTFEYWGSRNGTLNNLSGQIVSIEVEDANIDINPIFGSTVRYPHPVNPRDLLPVFDQWNAAQPGTVGHGLSNNPTLGGILPQMTQYDWQKEFDLQPGGLIYLDYINSTKITIDGNISDWDANQLVFNDISGDTDEDSNEISGVDIKNVYMAYNTQNLYGSIETYDEIGSGYYWYGVFLSYSPDSDLDLHSFEIEINVNNGITYGNLYYVDTDSYGWTYPQYINSFTAAVGQKAVEFKIPFSIIPDYLPGRYITVSSNGWSSDWSTSDGEENQTHLKLGEVGNISGTVAYNGFEGDPIFVQAYTDPEDPEGSAVATVMITQPGSYMLEGIGLGWQGYIRAFTPLFGFENLFESGAFVVQTSTPVWMMLDDLDDVDITINYPIELKKNVSRNGEIDSDTREVDWYYFDAVAGGTYTINLTRGTAQYACIALYDRNAEDELIWLDYWQMQQINWLCPTSGRYYIKVSNGDYRPAGGTYQIQMTSNITCPQADIANAQWVGVKDCKVDFYDLAAFVSRWLNSCSEPFWCGQADFNRTGSVNFIDFATLADEWLQQGI